MPTASDRRCSAFLGAVLLLSLLAGCLGGDPGPASSSSPDPTPGPAPSPGPTDGHVVEEIRAFEAEAADGTVLRGHVYLPNASGPVPVILNYSPYWNGASAGPSDGQTTEDGDSMTSSIQGDFGTLLEAGYAVALVNIRGTGASDGCNTWFHYERDGADARHVIEALANASWSNGNVGMVGISWHGYTQYAAQADAPDALKAVAPASSVIDLWSLFTRRGAPLNVGMGTMATTYAVFQGVVMGLPGEFPVNRAQCPEHAEQAQQYNQLTTHGDKTPWFQERTAHDVIAASDLPMFVTNGLDYGEGHLLQVDGLWPLMNDESRLMLGQWHHQYPDDDREDWYWNTLVTWFDEHLRDGPEQVPTGFVEYQDDEDNWHNASTWPPPGDVTRVHLSDGAVVADESEVEDSTRSFVASDDDPAPNACSAGKALYVSPPLEEDALLAGNFLTNFTVSSTAPRSNVGVYVWAVDEVAACPQPDAPSPHEDQVSRALSDLRHRGGHLEQGEPFPVDEPGTISMKSHPFASPVDAGERLVVAVVGGSGEVSPKDPDPLLTVHTGGDAEGWIDLRVVEGELVFEES